VTALASLSTSGSLTLTGVLGKMAALRLIELRTLGAFFVLVPRRFIVVVLIRS